MTFASDVPGRPRAGMALALALCAAGAAQAGELPYHLDDTMVGSLVPRTIVRSAAPVDGHYADLSAPQKAALAADYDKLAAGDEPPFPAYGLRHLLKPLVRYAELIDPVGPLELRVEVDAQGHAGDVSVFKSPDPKLSLLVAQALAQEPFKAATCQGQPCAMAFVLRLDFPARHAEPVFVSGFSRYDPYGASTFGGP